MAGQSFAAGGSRANSYLGRIVPVQSVRIGSEHVVGKRIRSKPGTYQPQDPQADSHAHARSKDADPDCDAFGFCIGTMPFLLSFSGEGSLFSGALRLDHPLATFQPNPGTTPSPPLFPFACGPAGCFFPDGSEMARTTQAILS